MKSLRNRAVAGGAIWATIVALAGTNAIGNYLDGLTVSRFDELLTARHSQAVVALANSSGASDAMPRHLANPLYQMPFSGNYWQAVSSDGKVLVSRSLTDALLTIGPQVAVEGRIEDISGPTNQRLRALSQEITIDDGSVWIVTVASSTATLDADRRELRRRLYASLAFVGLLGTVGALVMVLFTLRPLLQLKQDVMAHQDLDGHLPVDEYPQEVQPLVTEINVLLDRNREVIRRSRRQTADLAHALKTPSAVLRNEFFELARNGTDVQAGLYALERLDAQLDRSFARWTASQDSSDEKESTDLDESLNRLERAFIKLGQAQQREVSFNIQSNLRAKINPIDFEEVMGNLLDNALKWSSSVIVLTVTVIESWISIAVEDDGNGIDESQQHLAFLSGKRLDESKPGTGLGLSIASDLVSAYGGTLDLKHSERFGGAMVVVRLPKTA